VRVARIIAGVFVLWMTAPIVFFLAQADYGAIPEHPERLAVALAVVALALGLLFVGVTLIRSGYR
jgi:hypothetical protein